MKVLLQIKVHLQYFFICNIYFMGFIIDKIIYLFCFKFLSKKLENTKFSFAKLYFFQVFKQEGNQMNKLIKLRLSFVLLCRI